MPKITASALVKNAMHSHWRRRDVLVGCGIGLLGATPGALWAQSKKAMPIADMHTHLGHKTRLESTLDLAEEMKANHVLLAGWAYSTDLAYTERMPDGIHQVADPDPIKIAEAMRKAMRRRRQYIRSTGLGTVMTIDDLDRALAGLPSVVLAAEGSDFMQGRMSLLDEAFENGVRHLQLVHYTRNVVGDIQTAPPQHHGLSDFGRRLIRKAQAKGMLVDLAHSTEEAVGQALEVATKPVIWSHGWVDSMPGAFDDKVGWMRRRLSIDTAREIARTGGVVGVWGLGLKHPTGRWTVGRNDPKGYAKAILALMDKLGPDHVALGTDMAGVDESVAVEGYGDVRQVIQTLQGSLDEESLAKVSYRNYARVLRRSLVA